MDLLDVGQVDVNCTKSVIDSLRERNIIDIDDEFIKKHQLY